MARYTRRHASSGVREVLPKLETWPSQYSSDYEIVITIPEFTSICPKTGLPDFATLVVTYVPDRRCVELKSLKEYVNAYRNLGIFNENAVNRVLGDLVRALRPRRMAVRGAFTPRGGIQTTVEAHFPRAREGETRATATGLTSSRVSPRRSPAGSSRRAGAGGRSKAR
ncbi:MAG TPA: preQ(1) synthase [Thermoanaerobaculia bacterium]|nr:preQ(1) synthase [Thermoanaerobaculia bacterium]